MKTNRPVTQRQEQQHERALCTAILALRSVEECRSFFRDLCTPAELQAMADRWAVVELLERGLPYREMRSQAGHDAYAVATMAPTAMIFTPCFEGISHNVNEAIELARSVPGANLLLNAAIARANR